MTGRRLPDPPSGSYPYQVEDDLKPGDYIKLDTLDCRWIVMAPNGDLGSLSPKVHTIVEHEDGTITVAPSVQFMTGRKWHGYHERGIWRQV